jgi:hypothetical protein
MTEDKMDELFSMLSERDDTKDEIYQQEAALVSLEKEWQWREALVVKLYDYEEDRGAVLTILKTDAIKAIENYKRLLQAQLQEIENKIASKFKE